MAVRFPPRRGSTLIAVLLSGFEQVYDPSETRLLISHASPGREGLLSQLALVLKADLTVSAGLHFRYGVSYNEFSVQHDPDAFRTKLEAARKAFNEIWEAVKNQVEGVVECVLPCRFFPPDRKPALLTDKDHHCARAQRESAHLAAERPRRREPRPGQQLCRRRRQRRRSRMEELLELVRRPSLLCSSVNLRAVWADTESPCGVSLRQEPSGRAVRELDLGCS